MGAPAPFDVVVAGAGPAGATAARILALRGLRVAMVDPLDRPVERLELIAPAARPLLGALGLEDLLDDPAIARLCLGIRRCWGAVGDEVVDFLCEPGGAGHVVDRGRFDAALRERAVAAGAVDLRARVATVARRGGAFAAMLGAGGGAPFVAGGIVVDATGRAAAVARRLGAARLCLERRVATRCAGSGGSGAGAWLDVAGDAGGWHYALSGPGGRGERWHFRGEGPAGDRVDASSARLDRAAGDRWVAVGDAAAAFDPITSQGLANALSTAQVAAGMILESGASEAAAAYYADAVAATHSRSELARGEVYRALQAPAAA